MNLVGGEGQQGDRYSWRCPAPEPLQHHHHERLQALLHRMRACGKSLDKMSTSVGLEMRVAAAMLARENNYAKGIECDYIINKIRNLLVRPAVEPTLISYWRYLSAANLEAKQISAYLKKVSGKHVTERPLRSFGVTPTGNVIFEPIDESEKWLDKIKVAANNPKLRTAMPFYAYVQTIMAHPFSDGNGRLARSILQASLGVICGFRFPVIALAPAFYMHIERLNIVLTRLTDTGEWAECYAQMLLTLELATSMTENLIGIANLGSQSQVRVRFENVS